MSSSKILIKNSKRMNKEDKKCWVVWCGGLCVCEVCVRMKGMGVGGRGEGG